MCGRFALTLPKDAVIAHFGARPSAALDLLDIDAAEALERPRHNIRPTQEIWTITSEPARASEPPERDLRAMRWGYAPHWWKSLNDGPLLINARAETIAEKPAFKASARERRCLIPADGFYEWRAAAGRGQEPYWIAPSDGAPLAFAGVWRVWSPGPGADREIATVAIVTCAAEAPLADIHHRVPVRVAPEDYALWLGEAGRGAAALMRPEADGYWAHHRVSTEINKGGRDAPDGPHLRTPFDPAAPAPDVAPEPPPQGELF